jgi:Ser/Thr protein kinase RdoA (MazF antagonist)
MGEIYRVITDHGRYAVKRLFDWNHGDGVADEVAFTARARAAGVYVPMEMRDAAGNVVVTIDGTRSRVYEWCDLGPTWTGPVEPTVARDVGRLTGRLHAMGESTNAAMDPWYTTPPDQDVLSQLALLASGADKPWAKAFSLELPQFRDLVRIARGVERRELKQCHRDLDPSNVLPTADGHLAVLDWENVGPMAPEQEVGYLLVSWCTDGRHASPAAVVAFIEGYAETTGTRMPITRRTFIVGVNSWLNFLAVQAEAALSAGTMPKHRAFGEQRVQQLLDAPLRIELLDELVVAGQLDE